MPHIKGMCGASHCEIALCLDTDNIKNVSQSNHFVIVIGTFLMLSLSPLYDITILTMRGNRTMSPLCIHNAMFKIQTQVRCHYDDNCGEKWPFWPKISPFVELHRVVKESYTNTLCAH